jgi:DNA-binding transcriptional regulator YhcF (GntR family)
MKRAPEGLGPAVAVDRRLSLPLHRQIYDGYREAILDGRLRPGQRLPATRVLAQELRVSRIPVVTAFEQLVAEGYVESRVGAGSFVSSALPDVRPAQPGKRPQARPGPRHVPESRLPIAKEPWLALHGPFRASRPALDEFPAELWGRLVAKHARRLSPLQMGYGDPLGLPALREALAGHLRVVRSVKCTPEQIMIVSGSQQALALSSQALLKPGDAVWLEEPGYEGARDALKVAGARIIPVPVDEDGLDVTAGMARGPDARAAYITPSHQYPLGMIMSGPAPAAAAGVGAQAGRVALRGRLRQRVSLRRPGALVAAGPRRRRAGHLHRHVQQGALSLVARRLSGAAKRFDSALSPPARRDGHFAGAVSSSRARRAHSRRPLCAPLAPHARHLRRAAACAGAGAFGLAHLGRQRRHAPRGAARRESQGSRDCGAGGRERHLGHSALVLLQWRANPARTHSRLWLDTAE